jgi:sulfur carrier protein ThiS adenylyltransferase
MNLTVNEECLAAEPGTTPGMLRRRHYPSADLVILNGCPVGDEHPLSEGDRLVFITRGVVPSRQELEALMVARHTPAVFGRMKAASVGIAGVGGLGSAVALALARMGVGRLVLVDGDVVEPSNLNRQHYFTDQIGRRKVEAMAETLARVNPFCRVETHPVWLDRENIPAILAGLDVVVEAFDRAEAKVMLIDRVMEALPEVPVVAASGVAGFGTGNSVVIRRMTDRLWVVGDLETGAAPGTGLMAPRVGIAAHHQANAVVRLLMGQDPAE